MPNWFYPTVVAYGVGHLVGAWFMFWEEDSNDRFMYFMFALCSPAVIPIGLAVAAIAFPAYGLNLLWGKFVTPWRAELIRGRKQREMDACVEKLRRKERRAQEAACKAEVPQTIDYRGRVSMHWCDQETTALLASIPVIGAAYYWVRARLSRVWKWVRRR